MPAHHEIEETIDEYLSRVSIDDKQPLFQSVNKTGPRYRAERSIGTMPGQPFANARGTLGF